MPASSQDNNRVCQSRWTKRTPITAAEQNAAASFVASDPFVEWLLSDKDRLPADFELAI